MIQILSFLLIPGLFEAAVFCGWDDYFRSLSGDGFVGTDQVFGMDGAGDGSGGDLLWDGFFCGYFCSFGAVQDFLWFAGNKLKSGFRKQV